MGQIVFDACIKGNIVMGINLHKIYIKIILMMVISKLTPIHISSMDTDSILI